MRLFLFILIIFANSFIPASCLGQSGPQIISLASNPQTINNDGAFGLSWEISGVSTGFSLYIGCRTGIKITNYYNNSEIPCETRYSTGENTSQISLKAINIRGSAVSVPIKVYPKDITRNDYNPGAADIYVTVNPANPLITNFTASTTAENTITNPAVTTVLFEWSSRYLNLANFQFTCDRNINVYYSGSAAPLPCGRPALPQDVSGSSGSQTFTFANSSSEDISLPASLMPLVATGLYDGVQARSVSVNVKGRSPQKAILINSFTASNELPASGEGVVLSWDIANAIGANLQFVCNTDVAIMDSPGTTTAKTIPCGNPAFYPALTATASTTVYFKNSSSFPQSILVYVLPQNADGSYNGMITKQLSIRIMSPQTAVVSATPIPASAATANTALNTINTAGAGIKAIRTITFTQYLYKTSKASQVTALQRFLAQDKTLYPEGLVTGYFGSLTEAAVQRFQERYGIAKKGDDGYGYVGPKTRAKLNSLDYF